MKIYLVRHGQCDSNLNNIYNYRDEDLNQNGIEQAKNLKEKIKNINYDIVYSSPLLRAKHTAEIININNKRIVIDDRLREREPGNLEGQSMEVTDRDEYWNFYTNIKYGTEERIPELLDRVKEFLDDLKRQEYNSVLIVAHSGVSKAFSAYFEGIGDGLFLNRGLKNCEIKEYEL